MEWAGRALGPQGREPDGAAGRLGRQTGSVMTGRAKQGRRARRAPKPRHQNESVLDPADRREAGAGA